MVKDQGTFKNHIEEEGYIYAIYTTLDPKNRDTVYLLSDIQLYIVKTLGILQEYIDLADIFNKEAAYTLLNPILVKHKIDTGDK